MSRLGLRRSRLLLLPLVFASLSGCAVTDNAELQEMYEQDQADRTPGPDGIDWSQVSPRDSARRARVLELLDSGQVRSSADFHNAAMVFQHGNDTTAARMAHQLASRAVELDSTNSDAMWLKAAAWDRYRMRQGLPQWYGTQFVRDPGEPWRLYDVDTTAVTDEERTAHGVPSLAEQQARVQRMNNRQPDGG